LKIVIGSVSYKIMIRMARHWWLTPVTLATQEAEIRRITVQIQPRQIVCRPYLKNTQHKTGLAEWLKW
jgi:hypothetical protein